MNLGDRARQALPSNQEGDQAQKKKNADQEEVYRQKVNAVLSDLEKTVMDAARKGERQIELVDVDDYVLPSRIGPVNKAAFQSPAYQRLWIYLEKQGLKPSVEQKTSINYTEEHYTHYSAICANL